MNNKENKDQPEKFELHYIKNNDFRTVYADGAHGAITPYNFLSINFYLTRNPIPNRIDFEFDEENKNIGAEIHRDSKSGLIRELQTGVLMDLKSARDFREWLDSRIKEMEEINNPTKEDK